MRLLRIAILSSLVALLVPAVFAQSNDAVPGTVNYVEGAAAINGQVIHQSSVGTAIVHKGQFLSTRNGRVEILLTPGVFLRLGHNSTLQMLSPNLIHTQVRLTQGKAMVEVLQLYKENMLLVTEDGVTTRIVKPGLYEFDAHAGIIRTFNGRALAFVRPDDPRHPVVVRTSHQFLIPPQAASGSISASMKLKAQHFNRSEEERTDALYGWSSLRSRYLAEENASLAYEYAGYGAFAPGWYWNPFFWGYTWLPGDGMFWDPFGWGFYSPWYFYYGYPFYGYGGGYYGHGGYIPPFNDKGRGSFGAGRNFQGGPRPAFGGGHVNFGGGHIGGAMPSFGGGGFHGGAVGGGFHGGGGVH